MHVTHFTAGFLAHFIDVFLHPGEVVERSFVVGRHNCYVARTRVSWFGIHAQDDLFASGANQRVVKIGQRGDRSSIDRQNVIARFYIYADGGERRTRLLVPIFSRQNAVDAIRARGRVARDLGPEQAKLDSRRVRPFAAGYIGVAVVQFANHFAEQISEIVTVIHERKERGIFVAHRFPIDAVHRR